MIIFRTYMHFVKLPDQSVVLDANGVVSKACFNEWVATRVVQTSSFDYEKSFQRALTAHLTGSDGRKPFNPEEEVAVLLVVRQKRTWCVCAGGAEAEASASSTDEARQRPAFDPLKCTVGQQGFRALGYHERKRHAFSSDFAPSCAPAHHDPSVVWASGERQEAPAAQAGMECRKSTPRPHELLTSFPISGLATHHAEEVHADAMDLEVMVAPSSPLPDTAEDCAFLYMDNEDTENAT
jgi:hypothetical protein